MDHLTWIGAEVKALACGLSWQIFRLDCEVSILLVRFSVSSDRRPRYIRVSYRLVVTIEGKAGWQRETAFKHCCDVQLRTCHRRCRARGVEPGDLG